MKGALLGPQRLKPTLIEVVRALAIDGTVATVTAGWQEREDQDDDLNAHLGHKAVNLKLYVRGEQVLHDDPEFSAAHRARQDKLKQMQDYYRLRLAATLEAALDIARRSAGSELEHDEAEFSTKILRELDDDHAQRCAALRDEFDARTKPFERDAIVKHRRELQQILNGCQAIAIAGGHVAVLLNRLRMFGLTQLLKDQVLFAWSGGAMVTGDRVVLFHEDPPQGQGVAEVMDLGLGLHHGLTPLPSPRQRLKLEDRQRVSWFARRMAPSRCITFDNGEYVLFEGRRFYGASGTQWLQSSGEVSSRWSS